MTKFVWRASKLPRQNVLHSNTISNKPITLHRIFPPHPTDTNEYNIISYSFQNCMQSEKPFTVPIYETDAGGRPTDRSNSTVLPYFLTLNCSSRIMVDDGFMSTMDGNLYLNGNEQSVPAIEYCLEYSAAAEPQVGVDLQAFVCSSNFKSPSKAEDIRGSWKYIILLVGFVPSVVCLVLTLIVYAILPSLRNVHGYNVMCYVACLLVSMVSIMILQWTQGLSKSRYCILYGMYYLHCYHYLINSYHISNYHIIQQYI